MKLFFSNLKFSIKTWLQTWVYQLFFAILLLSSFSIFLFGFNTENINLYFTGMFSTLFTSWIWFLFCGFIFSENYSSLKFLKNIHKILLKGLLLPFGLALIWGNPYSLTLFQLISVDALTMSGKHVATLSLAVSASYILSIFVTSLIVDMGKEKPKLDILPELKTKNVFATMGMDLSSMWHRIKRSWDVSLPILIAVFIVLIPLGFLGGAVDFISSTSQGTSLRFIIAIPILFLFTSLSILPSILAGFVKQKYTNPIQRKKKSIFTGKPLK